jgi:hypothetical protein
MYVDGKITLIKDNAKTPDIIEALLNAVPLAIDQCIPEINKMIDVSGNAIIDAERCCRYIRSNVNYRADGFQEQNIQLPGRMFKNKKADCKSFSLAFVGMMEAAGYKNVGFRFASYRPNKIPTHVYNFVIWNGKKYIFDSCIKTLKESQKYTYIKDMKVNYLSGPCDGGIPALYARVMRLPRNQRAAAIQKFKADCPQRSLGEQLQSAGTQLVRGAKKIALAVPRNAFRALVSLNFRGLAEKLDEAIKKNPDKIKSFWEKLGGKFDGGDSLKQSINTGKDKKPLLGQIEEDEFGNIGFYSSDNEDSYIGEPATVAATIAAAAPIVVAVMDLLKTVGINKEDVAKLILPKEIQAGGSLPEAFIVEDKEQQGFLANFKPSPLVIGGIVGGIALIYFLTKKKR